METGDLLEVRTVFSALFDTCVQYLRSDIIIRQDSWFREHQDAFLDAGSAGDGENEALFRWILEDDEDTAIVQFVKTLKGLTCDTGSVHSIVRSRKQDEAHWIMYFASLLDGSLIKELSISDVHTVLDMMVDKKMITKQVHKQAREVQNPQHCCHIMFEGIIKSRGKSNWPFVFLDAISKTKPDLVQSKPENTEQHNQSIPQNTNNGDYHKAGSVMADSNTDTEELLCCLDKYSEFSDTFFNDNVEQKICISEEEFQSVSIQEWLNSGNVDRSSIAYYKEVHTLHAWEHTSENSFTKPPETPQIELRGYQEELAEAALEGNNTIICAPTGCGKTLVAVHIIRTHLQKQPDATLPRKVVFCARTVPLVMQQYRVLRTFLPPQFKVISLTGDDRSSLQLHFVIPDVDVIVMTPRILENHLIRNGQEQLDMFSLLVFDECHHTRKDEPYNMLMRYYLKRKQKIINAKNKCEQINIRLPQILGLTASIGVDNAKDDDQAKENILQICGNLDVEYISCVEKHIEELKEKVHLSKEELLTISERDVDAAVSKILEKMRTLEENMKGYANDLKHQELIDILSKIPMDRRSIHYGNWAVKVKNIARSLPRSELGNMNGYKRLLIILGDYLSTYNVALELHDLVLLRHVMEYLRRCFDQYQENKNCTEDEKAYFESFSDLQEMMKDQLDSENPNLTLLKTCLMKYVVAKGEASRGIIFVRTRALVRAVTSWLNSCGNLSIESLKAVPFTGTSASAAMGGMTAVRQSEIIQMFRSGQVRLLVATSVAEEGIDIPECNLVIKYNYTGNEITTVQTRGRSRKKGGMSVILAMSKIIQKEKQNQKKAEMMERAVQQIRLMDPLEIHKKIETYQQQILKDEEMNEIMKQQINKSKRREHFKMVCHGCGDVVIDSNDIKTIYQTHHVVVNWNIMDQTQTVAEEDKKLFDDIRLIGPVKCRGRLEAGRYCNNKLGTLMIFSNIPFVVLGLKRFGFESAGHTKLLNYKHWKLVPYLVDEIALEDFERYLPKLTAAEAKNNNRSQPSLGEKDDAVHKFQALSHVLQHNKRHGRKDKGTVLDVKHLDNMGGKPSSKKIRVHASLSFQASDMTVSGRNAFPGSGTNSGAICELEEGRIDVFINNWSILESKLSSTVQPVLHETPPSVQWSEASSCDADLVSTLHSDPDQEIMTEARADNVDTPRASSSSVEAKREREDTDMLTSSPVLVEAEVEEQTEAKNSLSGDAGSQIQHLAEVGDTFFPSSASYR